MPTVREVAEQVKFLLSHGRAEEKAVLVLPRVANRRKQKNPQKRFTKAMDDGHASRLYAVWDKWLEAAGNKTVGLEIMISTLEGITDEQIRAAANEQADIDFNLGKTRELSE
jgi:hypothetical protein